MCAYVRVRAYAFYCGKCRRWLVLPNHVVTRASSSGVKFARLPDGQYSNTVGPIGARVPKTQSECGWDCSLPTVRCGEKRWRAAPRCVHVSCTPRGSVLNAASTTSLTCRTNVCVCEIRAKIIWKVSQHVIRVPPLPKIAAITGATPSACRSPHGVSSVEAPPRAISCSLPTTCHAILPDVCTFNPSLVHTLCAQRIPAKFSPCRDPVALAPAHSALRHPPQSTTTSTSTSLRPLPHGNK
jgi:hypothetical protein